jgi:hypothetical protein
MACPDGLGLCRVPGASRKSQIAGRRPGRYRHDLLSRKAAACSLGLSPCRAASEINPRVFFRNSKRKSSSLTVTNAGRASW